MILIKDLSYHYEEWLENKIDHLFIVGLAGSGKSTTGRRIADAQDCIYISTDIYEGEFYEILGESVADALSIEEYINQMFIKLRKEIKGKRAVIEGVHALAWNPKELEKDAILIKNLSFIQSTLRAYKRDYFLYGSKHILTLLQDNWDFNNRLKRFKRELHIY